MPIKRQLCLYVDSYLVDYSKTKGWNLSELFNSMLQSMANTDTEPQITKEELNKKILDAQTELNRLKNIRIEEEKREKKGLSFEVEL